MNGTFDCKKGRVFVSYKEKQGALNALETMLITKEYHLQVSTYLYICCCLLSDSEAWYVRHNILLVTDFSLADPIPFDPDPEFYNAVWQFLIHTKYRTGNHL